MNYRLIEKRCSDNNLGVFKDSHDNTYIGQTICDLKERNLGSVYSKSDFVFLSQEENSKKETELDALTIEETRLIIESLKEQLNLVENDTLYKACLKMYDVLIKKMEDSKN